MAKWRSANRLFLVTQKNRCARFRHENAEPRTDAPRRGAPSYTWFEYIRAFKTAHSPFGTGLSGPSKFFRALWLQVRFSGATRLCRVPKKVHCSAKPPSCAESHLLLCFWRRILVAYIFKVHMYTHTSTHTFSFGVCVVWEFVWCEQESACMHVCARKILVSVSSLSFSLSWNQNDRWIVSECVSMSICEDTLSHLSRSFSVYVCVCVWCMYKYIHMEITSTEIESETEIDSL